MVVLRRSCRGDFIEESMLSNWFVKSLMAELGLLNFCGVPNCCFEEVSVLGVCPDMLKGCTF